MTVFNRRRFSRNGFSLMEVIVATAILLASAILLSELASVGRRHAASAEDLATAQMICQAKVNEMLAGAFPIAPSQDQPVEPDSDWVYSIEVVPLDLVELQTGIALVRVSVSQAVDGQRRGPQFTLTRWFRDPNFKNETQGAPPASPEADRGNLFDAQQDAGPSPRSGPGGRGGAGGRRFDRFGAGAAP